MCDIPYDHDVLLCNISCCGTVYDINTKTPFARFRALERAPSLLDFRQLNTFIALHFSCISKIKE